MKLATNNTADLKGKKFNGFWTGFTPKGDTGRVMKRHAKYAEALDYAKQVVGLNTCSEVVLEAYSPENQRLIEVLKWTAKPLSSTLSGVR